MLRKIKEILYRSIENKEISYRKLTDMVKKNTDIILLDVRSYQEYMENHLECAINIPVFDLKATVEKRLENKEQTIIVYCATGSRSRRAKEVLENLGYKNVYNLKNGLDCIE